MPIYGYHCSECGYQKDVLQKMSDAPLTECPSCGAKSFTKQVSAPAFQLKGTGWYVTDFRDGGKPSATAGKTDPAAPAADAGKASGDSGKSDSGKSDSGKSEAKSAASPAPKAAESAKSAAPASKS